MRNQGDGRMATEDGLPVVPKEGEPSRYMVNEIFYSLQGEGRRAGTANVFVRFAKCNLECRVEAGPRSPGGFDCDTEFESGTWMSLEEMHGAMLEVLERAGSPFVFPSTDSLSTRRWIVLTGGEPALQLNLDFCHYFHLAGFLIAVETNGSMLLPFRESSGCGSAADLEAMRLSIPDKLKAFAPDWITVSPKVAEHAIRQLWAHEVKYVRGYGQAVPQTKVKALHRLISPAFDGLEADVQTLAWCVDLVKTNPAWDLSIQMHKLWVVR